MIQPGKTNFEERIQVIKHATSGSCPFAGGMPNVNSASEMEEVLRSPVFEKRGGGAYLRPNQAGFILGGTLINLSGDQHRARRRMYSPLFASPKVLMDVQTWLIPTIKKRVNERAIDEGGRAYTDIVKFVRNISLEIAARVIGLDDMEPIARVDLLGSLADRLMGSIKSHLDAESSVDGAADPQKEKEEFVSGRVADAKAAKEDFIRIFYQPARQRREELVAEFRAGRCAEADLPKDALTLLILNEETLRSDSGWDEDLPIRECLMFLAAADHTTSMAACHAITDLFTWVADHPEDKPKLTDVGFVLRAALESLRLHQVTDPNPNLRAAKKEVVLSTGRRVAEGEVVAMRFGVGGRDPEHFGEDADQFNPHRPSPGNLRKPWGFAFSGGVHGCLGQPLVIGTGDGQEFKGDLPLILITLFEAGMVPDPAYPAVPKIHAHVDPESGVRREIVVWSRYRVIFG